MPQYAILFHELPPHEQRESHWDLMLQTGSFSKGLSTWALARPPQNGIEIAAQQLPDHRPEYLDYEGPISGDRGAVTQWDRGTCQIIAATDERWEVLVNGRRLQGSIVLERQAGAGDQRWRFTFSGEIEAT